MRRSAANRAVVGAALTLGLLLAGSVPAGASTSQPATPGHHKLVRSPLGALYNKWGPAEPGLGAFTTEHQRVGGTTGPLGFPISAQRSQAPGYLVQQYERGDIYQSPAGTFAVGGDVAQVFSSHGGATSLLGYPTSAYQAKGNGYGVQNFERGVIYTSRAGTYAVMHSTGGDAHRANGGGSGTWGYPTSDLVHDAGSGRYQLFERGVMTWAADGRVAFVTLAQFQATFAYSGQGGVATSSSAILLCDSHCGGDSWMEQGLRANGYTNVFERGYGGGGYVAPSAGYEGMNQSLTNGAINGGIPLPTGNPGLIVISLGDNDTRWDEGNAAILRNERRLITELRARYPWSTIVVNGVVSRSGPAYQRQHEVDALVTGAAARAGALGISAAGWGDSVANTYVDGIHMNQAGHNFLAGHYRWVLWEALRSAGVIR